MRTEAGSSCRAAGVFREHAFYTKRPVITPRERERAAQTHREYILDYLYD